MKATGIVAEYNPFHNGHKHHVQQAKSLSNADAVVAVMSGQFLQRGEPAFVDKWSRTRMALTNGVDLVVELPYAYATAQAAEFAKGAITILDALQCDSFCFGSEQGDIQPFLETLQLLNDDRARYEALVRSFVQSGLSYPKALNEAYQAVGGKEAAFADMTQPNNILGYHYIEAARKIGSSMHPLTIRRKTAGYYDDAVAGEQIASATGIRKLIFENADPGCASAFLPDVSTSELETFRRLNGKFVSWELFYPQLRYAILRDGPKRIREYAEVAEGIENLLFEAAKTSGTFQEFMAKVKTKRYTWTRIQRMLTHIYTGFTWEQLRSFQGPEYIRILGMTSKGRFLLNERKKDAKLPLISRAADLTTVMGKLDIHASFLYQLGTGGDVKKEFSTPPAYFG